MLPGQMKTLILSGRAAERRQGATGARPACKRTKAGTVPAFGSFGAALPCERQVRNRIRQHELLKRARRGSNPQPPDRQSGAKCRKPRQFLHFSSQLVTGLRKRESATEVPLVRRPGDHDDASSHRRRAEARRRARGRRRSRSRSH